MHANVTLPGYIHMLCITSLDAPHKEETQMDQFNEILSKMEALVLNSQVVCQECWQQVRSGWVEV